MWASQSAARLLAPCLACMGQNVTLDLQFRAFKYSEKLGAGMLAGQAAEINQRVELLRWASPCAAQLLAHCLGSVSQRAWEQTGVSDPKAAIAWPRVA